MLCVHSCRPGLITEQAIITSFLSSPPFILAAIGAFSYSFDESLLQSVIESVLSSSPTKNRKQYLIDKYKSNLLKPTVLYKLNFQ